MDPESRQRIAEAFKIVERHHRCLVEKMAAEIVEHRDEFENPFIGGAEHIIEKYYQMLSCVFAVKSELSQFLPPPERKISSR